MEHFGHRRSGGTRGLGRLLAMALALAAGLLLMVADAARAGTYEVVDCGWGVGTEGQWVAGPAEVRPASYCDPSGPGTADASMLGATISSGATLAPGPLGGWRWLTPPGVLLATVSMNDHRWVEYGLRRQIGWLDGSGGFHLIDEASGYDSGAGRVEFRLPFAGTGFAQRIACVEPPSGPCTTGGLAWSFVGQLLMGLVDEAGPEAALDGGLAKAGWRRGNISGTLVAGDRGSGVQAAEVLVDGARVAGASPTCATATVEGEVFGARLQPCPPAATIPVELGTAALADGPHELRACATDYSGGGACSTPTRLLVDNTPPLVVFDATTAARSGQVSAEVSDTVSRPAAGTISYRAGAGGPWTELPTRLRRTGEDEALLVATLPAGRADDFLFRAEARDAAGNLGTSILRTDGSSSSGPGGARGGGRGRPTRLRAWLGGGEEALTVGFGRSAVLRGRLVDAGGRGLDGERLRVAVRPARGAKAGTSSLAVETGADGRFALRLAAGTSRLLLVSFAGAGGLAASRSRPLHLRVRGGIAFAAEPRRLRTGETVAFSGRVRGAGARLPRRGKLVAISYRERATGRWRPVMVVRSDGDGAFRARYRFRYVTGRARIRLRAIALAESGWPYAAGASAPLTIEVRG